MYIHDFFQNFLKTFLVCFHGAFTSSVIAPDMPPPTTRGWRGEGGGYRGAAAASGRAAPDSSTARRRLAAATLIGSDQTRPLRKALSHIRDLGGLIPVHLHLRPDAAAEEEVQ